MIEAILPPGVVSVDTRGECLGEALFAAEQASLGDPVDKRRREFTTARVCAHRALEQLGRPAAPIPSGGDGEPCWPEGVVGSITHCAGYRGCALAEAASFAAIGIDAEPHAPLPAGVLDQIALREEMAWVRTCALSEPSVHWERLLFCAKESLYKAWFPLSEQRPGFHDALVTMDSRQGRFEARLLRAGPELGGKRLRTLHGRWSIRDGLILTAVTIASASCAQCAPASAA
jgi:4'-phosphopantetheinyl transferase EntD